jgi:very-short-patch-repair endonuclease
MLAMGGVGLRRGDAILMAAPLKKTGARSLAEEYLARSLAETRGLPAFVREYRFHPDRLWRFDFAFPGQRVAVEIDGRGRHQTVDGVRKDCEKLNEAARLGWRVLRFPATDRMRAREWALFIRDVVRYRRN